jgi:predicted PurR-regulated permease PerM
MDVLYVHTFKSNKIKSAIFGIYSLLLITFIVLGLYVGSVILVPITLAILLAFLLTPLVSSLERVFGRVIAVIIIVIMMSMVIGTTTYILGRELIQFTSNLPKYSSNIKERASALLLYDGNLLRPSAPQNLNELNSHGPIANIAKKTLIDYSQVILNFVGSILGSFINIVLTILLILLLMSFVLIEREDLRGRFIRLVGQERIGATTSTINDAGIRVAGYLRVLLLVNIVYGLFVFLGLHLLGIPNALLWGALSTLLRFVPYVGVWIAAAVPIAISFAITSTWILPLITIGLFVVLETVVSNVFEPWLYGLSTGVSKTALIIAAIFWTFLWGPIGLILSTPITVCLVVLGRHVPKLEFLSILLSDEEPLTAASQFYHRLLSQNTKETIVLTDAYLKENPLISLYDQVLVQVVARAEIDIRKDKLDEDQIQLFYQNFYDLIEDLNTRSIGEKTEGKNSLLKNERKELILCIPAKTKGDELVGEMLAQLLMQKHYRTFNMLSTLQIEKTLEFIKHNKTEMIFISALSPHSIIKARYLVRLLRNKFKGPKIIIGLWDYSEKLDDIKETFLPLGTDIIVTTLSNAVLYVDSQFNVE